MAILIALCQISETPIPFSKYNEFYFRLIKQGFRCLLLIDQALKYKILFIFFNVRVVDGSYF
jgi:hypothetical protein